MAARPRYGLEVRPAAAWSGLDARTCGPAPGCAPKNGCDEALDPASAWARFAMRAPVTFVRGGDDVLAVGCSVPFSRWASGAVKLGNRPPTAAAYEQLLAERGKEAA